MAKAFASEADLAKTVVNYLTDLGFECFSEVEAFQGRADIVATQKPIVAIVECKQSLTIDVIAQAVRWRNVAHRIYIAVPQTKTASHGRDFAYRICEDHGIGVLECVHGFAREKAPARLNRRANVEKLIDLLRPEHKTCANAGTQGGYYTPFRNTCTLLTDAVRAKPGLPLRELLATVKHHYASTSSAVSSLTHWIELGKVPTLRLERKGKLIHVHLVDTKSMIRSEEY